MLYTVSESELSINVAYTSIVMSMFGDFKAKNESVLLVASFAFIFL